MIPPILKRVEALGYKVFSSGPYDLNLFGIRSSQAKAGSFDDWMGCAYQDEKMMWVVEWWPATTDPGVYWLEGYDSSRVKGTAILVPGQYRGVYKIDKHGGKYEALCQRNGPVKVWRDSNRDDVLDWSGPEYEGMYGINLHHASYNPSRPSTVVNKWSAGCQVHAGIHTFERMMSLARLQIKHHPTWAQAFTYTLITEDD